MLVVKEVSASICKYLSEFMLGCRGSEVMNEAKVEEVVDAVKQSKFSPFDHL